MAKTAKELMDEAEDLQKKVAPELYESENKGTSDDDDKDGTLDDKKTASGEDEKTPDEKAEEERIAKEAEAKAEEDRKKTELDDPYKAEIAKLKDELVKVKATAGRVTQTAEANERHKERIAELERELKKGLKTVSDELDDDAKAKEDETLSILIEEYGEDSPAVRMYKSQKKDIEALKGKVEEIGSKVETAAIKTEAQKFLDSVADKVPDWESIKEDPKFSEFLDEKVGELTDRTLLQELREAAQKKDTKATIRIYNAFKEKNPSMAIDDTPSKKGKERLLAPGSSARADGVKTDIPIYTSEEIEKMTKEMSTLRRRGDHKAADKIKKKIDEFTDSLGSFK